MGRVIVMNWVTLDGVMQGPARPDEDTRDGFEHGGWGAAAYDPAMQQAIGARMGPSWSLLVGRVTFEDFADVWPNRPQPNPMGDALTNARKFVASKTLKEPLPWQNSTVLKGDAAEAVGRLKSERPDNLVIFGSGVLVQSLMRRGLVDEFVLQVHPIVLGTGRRLFPDSTALTKLRLVESLITSTGVIVATYERSW